MDREAALLLLDQSTLTMSTLKQVSLTSRGILLSFSVYTMMFVHRGYACAVSTAITPSSTDMNYWQPSMLWLLFTLSNVPMVKGKHTTVSYHVANIVFDRPVAAVCSPQHGLVHVHWEHQQEVQYQLDCGTWTYFCQGSGWGDEEATVLCRELGYSHGVSGAQ